jgi:peroxiredoxin
MARPLNVGDLFPRYDLQTVQDQTLHIPEDLSGAYSVLLFYRGNWRPYCNRQLADFQSHIEEFKRENVEIVALSVDPFDKARETVEKLQLMFPVASQPTARRNAGSGVMKAEKEAWIVL